MKLLERKRGNVFKNSYMVLKLKFHVRNYWWIWGFFAFVSMSTEFKQLSAYIPFDSFAFALRERINYRERKTHWSIFHEAFIRLSENRRLLSNLEVISILEDI